VRLAVGAAAAVVARVPGVAAQPPRVVTDTAAVATATTFVRALERGAWVDAAAVSALVPPAGTTQVALLRGLWTQLVGQLGTLAALEAGPVAARGDSRIVDLGGRFDRSEVTLRVVLGPTGKVSGFWVTPPRPPAYTPPPYADTARVREQELTLGAEPPLGATFTAPRAHAGSFPVAVLVHGSGPNDRDERVGANRPFRDLALGLASRGVAVLRYDKRTYAHPRSLAGRRVTVDAETIDDAVAAVALARTLPGADPARVFVVGHSLGGMLAPEIAARDGRAAGVVLLAPGGRPLAETAGEQAEYLAGRARAAGQPTAPYDALRAQLGDLAARRVAPDVWCSVRRRHTGTTSTTAARWSARARSASRCSRCSAAATTRSPRPTSPRGAAPSPVAPTPPSRCGPRSTTCSCPARRRRRPRSTRRARGTSRRHSSSASRRGCSRRPRARRPLAE
jgi:dienelactone hydrolase